MKLGMTPIQIGDLEFGHKYPGGSLNDRVAGQEAQIDALAANIGAHGLVQPLAVWHNPAKPLPVFVLAGNRRLAALRKAAGSDKKLPVACVQIEAPTFNDALAKAMDSNFFNVEPSLVDQYETFARLAAGGMTEGDIAKRYSLKPKEVKQVLALGALAPEILAQWRLQKVSDDTAQAFTIEPDKKRQVEIFEKLKKRHALYGHMVRQEIAGNASDQRKMIGFVGQSAYEKAGGTGRIDLFSRGDDAAYLPADAKLLKKLFDEKLAAKIKEIEAEGWKWVKIEDDLRGTNLSWQSGKAKASIPAAKRKGFGVRIDVNYDGKFSATYGLADAKAEKAIKQKTKKKKAKSTGDLSEITGALEKSLAAQLASIVRGCLRDIGGVHATLIADMIEPDRPWGMPDDIVEAMPLLAGSVPAQAFEAAAQRVFDMPGYLKSMSRAQLAALIRECDPKQKPEIANEKRDALVKLAAGEIKRTKWLPKELRASFYPPKVTPPVKKKRK
jgi:ParB-like chromosome segregation protein Spo0J